MTPEQTIILNKICNDVAIDSAYSMVWDDIDPDHRDKLWPEVCLRYAEKVNKIPGHMSDINEVLSDNSSLKSILKALKSMLVNAELEIERLKAFKDYVHKRLDDAGIEKDPESVHKDAGCRIGGRLDIVLNDMCTKVSRQKIEKEIDRVEKDSSCSSAYKEAKINGLKFSLSLFETVKP